LTKKCKKTLIFAPIFTLKTNMSYIITLYAIANHSIFQNFSQKPYFLKIYLKKIMKTTIKTGWFF